MDTSWLFYLCVVLSIGAGVRYKLLTEQYENEVLDEDIDRNTYHILNHLAFLNWMLVNVVACGVMFLIQ